MDHDEEEGIAEMTQSARRTINLSVPSERDRDWLLSDAFVERITDHFTRAKANAIRDLKASGIEPAGEVRDSVK